MTIEERVKTLLGDLMISLEMMRLENETLKKRIAELEGPHAVLQRAAEKV